MSEGHDFEQQHEIPPQPQVDTESVLENGEIIDKWPLEGWPSMHVVSIKDDGKGLFRPEETEERGRPLRMQLELLARLIDKVLGTGLVPETVKRNLGNQPGTLQHYYDNAVSLVQIWIEKPDLNYHHFLMQIGDNYIINAALFDYLINAADRRADNVLLDRERGKIYLVDHDDLMFQEIGGLSFVPNVIMNEAKKRSLDFKIADETKIRLETLVMEMDSTLNEPQKIGTEALPEALKKLLVNIKQRALNLINTGAIPA